MKENYKLTAIDLSKQQVPVTDKKTIPEINSMGNLESAGNTTVLFIIEEVKETILDFSQGTAKVL